MLGDGALLPLHTQQLWPASTALWNSSFPAHRSSRVPFSLVPPIPALHFQMPSRFAATQLRHAASNPFASSCTDIEEELDAESDWELEILDEIDPLQYLNSGKRRTRRSRSGKGDATIADVVSAESDDFNWAERARNRACIAVQERNPSAASFLKKKILTDPSKKGARRKKGRTGQELKHTLQLPGRSVDASFKKLKDKDNFGKTNDTTEFDDLRKHMQELADKTRLLPEQVNEREKAFNRRLVNAACAQEVLEIVGSALEITRSLGAPSRLTPLNTATALHRIAKHMESSGMPKSDRLAFARKRDMAELVGRAIEGLAGCSAQGLSNIAWALCKVGGSSLYFSEMDRIAGVALEKISDFNTQNIANMVGAFASMQHSVPTLFSSLASHASGKAQSFKPQELAQVLWAFATLFQPLNPLFDALDRTCESISINPTSGREFNERNVRRLDADSICIENDPAMPSYGSACSCGDEPVKEFTIRRALAESDQPSKSDKATSAVAETEDTGTMRRALQSLHPGTYVQASPFDNATAKQWANCAWSYAVLNQIERPSFKYLWQKLESSGSRIAEDNSHRSSSGTEAFLSQIHLVNLCLRYEYPHLRLTLKTSLKDLAVEAWERHKSDSLSTSVHQKHVDWLLVSTGKNWVAECTAADYSLDLALVEEKVAIEFDGPSHFARNTGSCLGNTLFKKRLLACAGWTILSIPFQEWEDLDGEAMQRQYLKGLLGSKARMDSLRI